MQKKGTRVERKTSKGSKTPSVTPVRRRLSILPGQISVDEAARLDGAGTPASPTINNKLSTGVFGKDGVVACHSSLSRVGYVPFNTSKVNQDRFTENLNFANDPSKSLFGVFDGHGVYGHFVSQFLITNLPGMIAAGKDLDTDPKPHISKTFMAANAKLDKSGIDCTCSGTTAVVCYIDGKKVYTCNAGDSRAVLGYLGEGKKLKAKALSIDQKPEVESEAKRIVKSNGRVQACQDVDGTPIGPKRVWLKHQDIPGLAMTRSFGDKLAASVGVTCEPEILEHDLKEGVDQFIILASDGVWEFIDNQSAVEIVAGEKSAKAAALALVDESTKRWKEEEDVIDDITCTIVYFKGAQHPVSLKN